MMLSLVLGAIGLTAGFLMARSVPVCSKDEIVCQVSVSVIIPARNEERNLPRLLTSIAKSAFRPIEVLVVDDASTDNTAAVAERFRARILRSSLLPAGWTGKTWACWQGSHIARGELLLFLDADTYFADRGLEAMVARWLREERGGAALSVLPYHTMQSAYEQLGLIFNALMAAGAGGFGAASKAHLFGQSLLISKDAYCSVNGHAAVKDEVLENVALARILHDTGKRTVCLGGRGMLAMRMFPDGLRQMADGWGKAFLRGAQASGPFALVCSISWITILWGTAILLVVSTGDARLWFLAVYLLLGLHLAWFARQLGSYRILTCLLYPLPLAFFCGVFGRSAVQRALGHKTLWRGRPV